MSVQRMCQLAELPRASFYRWQPDKQGPPSGPRVARHDPAHRPGSCLASLALERARPETASFGAYYFRHRQASGECRWTCPQK